MGRIAFKDCDYSAAKNHFAQAIMAASSAGLKDFVVSDAYVGMGRCLLEEGKPDDAAKFFKAIEGGSTPATQVLVQEELETEKLR
jgi:hypothetical protein